MSDDGRLFVARAERNSLFLMKNGDFTREELAELLSACARRGAEPVFGPIMGLQGFIFAIEVGAIILLTTTLTGGPATPSGF